jgi:hypothetical protein
VAYDALAESLALVEHGVREDPPGLSRRRRSAALAVDVDGDIACTLFLVRGPGSVRYETHALARRDGVWALLGGGGGGGPETGRLDDRPGTAELGAPVVVAGAGAVAAGGSRLPWGGRYVRDTQLRVSSAVHTVAVGQRVLRVPRHGHLVVVWSGRRPPRAVARGADGEPVCTVPLS